MGGVKMSKTRREEQEIHWRVHETVLAAVSVTLSANALSDYL